LFFYEHKEVDMQTSNTKALSMPVASQTGQNLKDFLFTSESVSEGHPDKICDQISDAILDLYMADGNTQNRSAVETVVTTDYVGIIGEARGPASIDHALLEKTAREVIKKIGYEQEGFHWNTAQVDVRVHSQSADIAVGVDEAGDKDEGAGDQGIMFGYACRETDAYMPAAIHFSHQILKDLADARHSGVLSALQPDAKAQVSLEYRSGLPVRATSVVLSTQHLDGYSQADIREMVRPYIERVLPEGWMPEENELYVNPTGRFVIGGPVGDSGLTGRKIIVDTYGGFCPHGGGAFSGKDPTKVDRSAAYAARYVAKNIVAAGYADQCTIQLSYAIGVSKPLSIYINTHGTGTVPESELVKAVYNTIDLSPRGIRNHLKLNRPIYARTAAYGHFGRDPEADGGFSWEKLDLIDALRKEVG
jgi:S-adenosylmethionine synthetase